MIRRAAEIALEGATSAYDKLYTYIIPPELAGADAGCRVLVPFGRGNSEKQGIIFRLVEAEDKGFKSISSLIDKTPVLNAELLGLCEHMRENCFCTYYDAVRAMLPTGINYKLISYYSANEEFSSPSLLTESERSVYDYLLSGGEKAESAVISALGVTSELLCKLEDKGAVLKTRDAKRNMKDAAQKWVRSAVTDDAADSLKLTPRQSEILSLVSEAGGISVKELCYYTGASLSTVNNMIKKGLLVSYQKQVFRLPYSPEAAPNRKEIKLNEEQQAAFEGMCGEYAEQKGAVSLLYGVTGSGKTQVFLRLVDAVADSGRGVIVMVPEIALTPQMIGIFTARYGDKIAVFHSAMSMGQRMDEWQRIKSGRARIAVGTRSAVFAPFDDLGLIIIDEEQEHTYKSEKSPRFHARELAKYRVKYNKGLLCLASATPSLESFAMAKSGRYSLYRLARRYGNSALPEVITVDMKKEILGGNASAISRTLYGALEETLGNKKQAILLLNRRGHNTYVSCPDCGYVAACPNCSISLTYHSANNRLMCHYCGYSVKASEKCPQCGKEHMKYMGLGTQKVEEELNALFPDADILRVDADSTTARESYAEYMGAFSRGEYDILLGTQMVAKGLDFPNVTLVGVLGADSAMYSEDFRSFERTFSLLTQVVGRAGRGDSAGLAVVQTLNPESNIIELAARQDYEGFYEEEILTRKLMTYPPYCDICLVAAQAERREAAEKAINIIFSRIKETVEGRENKIKMIILGPAPASIPRVNGKYRFRMIIKCRGNRDFKALIRCALEEKLPAGAVAWADMNPETVI